ncbi:prephenate dehydrogenase [Candidatus Magnetoovum chiemensis]|nr:prephenate dehydrogenase [Candidatus Magnetoovum chiemensis]
MFFNKTAIIGVGLLGASIALALKEKKLTREIYGCGRQEERLKTACQIGIIDKYSLNYKDLCSDADLIILATPVGTFRNIVEHITPHLKNGTILSDVGSVKGSLVYEIENSMPDDAYYVGAHPIAGSEKSGFEAAASSLFDGANCIITPTDKTNKNALSTIKTLWETLGCNIIILSPQKHDAIFSSISHMPHIIAYALVNTIGEIDPDFLKYSGRGFIDTTRIAMSSSNLWRDICLLNKENIITHIEIYKNNLDKLKSYIENSSSETLSEEIEKARCLRLALTKYKEIEESIPTNDDY